MGETAFEIEHGSRVSKVGGQHEVRYDARGFLVARHNYTFAYSPDGRLVETRMHGRTITRFVYDGRGRILYQASY